MSEHEPRDATGSGPDSGDDVASLLGAYALDALDDVDRRRVERLLEHDPAARAEADRLSAATDRFAEAAAVGDAAPSGLWASIAAQLDEPVAAGNTRPATDTATASDAATGSETASASGSDTDAASVEVQIPASTSAMDEPTPLGDRRARSSRRRPAAWVLSAAATVVLVAAGVAIGSRLGGDDSTDPVVAMRELTAKAATEPGARTAELTDPDASMAVKVVVDPAGHGFVMSDALPALDSGETYQLWAVDGGTPISLGLLGSDPTMSVVGVDGRVTTLAITREPAGGSADPTTTPMASGTLAFT